MSRTVHMSIWEERDRRLGLGQQATLRPATGPVLGGEDMGSLQGWLGARVPRASGQELAGVSGRAGRIRPAGWGGLGVQGPSTHPGGGTRQLPGGSERQVSSSAERLGTSLYFLGGGNGSLERMRQFLQEPSPWVM